MDNSKIHLGALLLDSIQNEIKTPAIAEFQVMDTNHIRCIHYPDVQQLIIWLPNESAIYQTIGIKHIDTGTKIMEASIRDVMVGPVKIVLDSLPIPPGLISVSIRSPHGTHNIILRKLIKKEEPLSDELIPKIWSSKITKPHNYHDGNGRALQNEDLLLRDEIIKKTINLFTRSLQYKNYGRDGEVKYLEGDQSIRFYKELGGGECIFFLHIPAKENWEKQTGFSLDRRDEILNFVAEGTKKDHAPNCRFEIREQEILYFRVS